MQFRSEPFVQDQMQFRSEPFKTRCSSEKPFTSEPFMTRCHSQVNFHDQRPFRIEPFITRSHSELSHSKPDAIQGAEKSFRTDVIIQSSTIQDQMSVSNNKNF
ncbi:hypothetical protein CEXT_279451 [Caerostris extrusa]|uniref:Uncharacterized protein n=1 Tax=Caerostris extrusa TaxID=172846 RepID=A0AAV4R401_CAEEX|nr:hypothetical protein CEXT_279451 [Caerostris extrusa]